MLLGGPQDIYHLEQVVLSNIITGDLMSSKESTILFTVLIVFIAMLIVAVTFNPPTLENTPNPLIYHDRFLYEPPLNIMHIINLFEPWPNTVSVDQELFEVTRNTSILDELIDMKMVEKELVMNMLLSGCEQSLLRDYLRFLDENDMVLGVSIYFRKAKLYTHGGIEKIEDDLYRVVEQNISKAVNLFNTGVVNLEKLKYLGNSSIKEILCNINTNDARSEIHKLYMDVRMTLLPLLMDAEKYSVPGNISDNNVRIVLYALQAYLSRLYSNESSIIMNETIYRKILDEKGAVWMIYYLMNTLFATKIYYTIMKHPEILVESVKDINNTDELVSLATNAYSAVLNAYRNLDERKPLLRILYKYVIAKQTVYRINDLIYYQQVVNYNKDFNNPNIMLKAATLKLLPVNIDKVVTEVILR